jgi:hypothetical protein
MSLSSKANLVYHCLVGQRELRLPRLEPIVNPPIPGVSVLPKSGGTWQEAGEIITTMAIRRPVPTPKTTRPAMRKVSYPNSGSRVNTANIQTEQPRSGYSVTTPLAPFPVLPDPSISHNPPILPTLILDHFESPHLLLGIAYVTCIF